MPKLVWINLPSQCSDWETPPSPSRASKCPNILTPSQIESLPDSINVWRGDIILTQSAQEGVRAILDVKYKLPVGLRFTGRINLPQNGKSTVFDSDIPDTPRPNLPFPRPSR
eukprot:sb/3477096/